MSPDGPPPFAPGDRVRRVASTAEELGGIELLGYLGTVERCQFFHGDGSDPGWDVRVVWDGLLPRMLIRHDPEELGPADT